MEFNYSEIAAHLRISVDDPEPAYFVRVFSLSDQDIVRKFARPEQSTLLHRLIQVECEIAFRAIWDNYGPEVLENYLLDQMAQSQTPQELREVLIYWYKDIVLDNQRSRLFAKNDLLCAFLPPSTLVDKLFYTLFMDHQFLFKFNSVLAHIVTVMKQAEFPDYLFRDGRIKRVHIPSWLKRGIYKRDQGHCANCSKDVSGLRNLATLHYDHIIPLAAQGNNDPANFQLLCEQCNLNKSSQTWIPPENDFRFW